MQRAESDKADFWKKLGSEFRLLDRKQRALVRKMNGRASLLCATFDCGLESVPLSNLIVRELVCLLYRLDSVQWKLTKGPNEDFRPRFEALASRAGIALDPPKRIAPLDWWLHNLRLHLIRTKSTRLVARADGAGGYIQEACKASANFCSWLEKRALESAMSIIRRGEGESELLGKVPAAAAKPVAPERQHKDSREMERLLKESPPESVRPFIDSLTQTQTNDYILRFGHSWTISRIARATGRNRKTVSESIQRASAKVDKGRPGKATKMAKAHAEGADLEDTLIEKIDSEKQHRKE